jgi:hypothetical protein
MLTYANVCMQELEQKIKALREEVTAGMLTYAHVCSTYAGVCWRMLTDAIGAQGRGDGRYAHVCSRMLTYAHVCSRMLDVCWRVLTYAGVCWRMLTDAIGAEGGGVGR